VVNGGDTWIASAATPVLEDLALVELVPIAASASGRPSLTHTAYGNSISSAFPPFLALLNLRI
jgi:hypothetical protein